jgi:cytochrome c oxidase accessory protein FixG
VANPRDLVRNDEHFFAARRKVFPKTVHGAFRRLKWAIMGVTLAIYYVTPWLRWDRGPFAPDQAVLVDLANRRFYMFAIEIWPHEFYYVAGLLIMAAIGLFLVTSAVGRAWCGYACPQTVWTDLFVHVERWIEGDRNAQIKLDRAPWGAAKIAKRSTKIAAWLVIAAATGGAWVFYFTDAPTLARQLLDGTAPSIAWATIGVLTFTTFTLGGLMREQVCIYMCPWPRIQGAMMDERTLVVTYKDWRGEPRSHGLKRGTEPCGGAVALTDLAAGAARVGDCIDCNACVAACPTGIDIREGPQIGCITCGLCIDACDEMMIKVDRPTRLIGYTTELDGRLESSGQSAMPPLRRLLRPRTIAYLGAWSAVGCAMLFTLGTRARLTVEALQDRNPIWVRLSDGSIRNSYAIKVRNMEARPRQVELRVTGIAATLWTDGGSRKSGGPAVRITVPADQVARVPLFVIAADAAGRRVPITVVARALDREGGTAIAPGFFERPE